MGFQKAFEVSEYKRRIADVKNRMESAGIDMLICQDPANMCWMTGFDGWSFYTPQAVVLHHSDEWPIWFGREQDAKSAHMTTDLPAENIFNFSEPLVHHPDKHPFDELCDLLKSRNCGTGTIGVDFDAHYYTARAHQHLTKGLPNAKIIDNKELVNWARLVKSSAEVHYMREAGKLSTLVMNNALDKVKPGMPQSEIMANVYHDQVLGIDGKFGDYTVFFPFDPGPSGATLTALGQRTMTGQKRDASMNKAKQAADKFFEFVMQSGSPVDLGGAGVDEGRTSYMVFLPPM